jgi:hypothetical protein
MRAKPIPFNQVEEKMPRVLWEEQTRDASTKMKMSTHVPHDADDTIKSNLIAHKTTFWAAVPAYHHSGSSHNGQTACRPRQLHQHPGLLPRPKSQNAFTDTLDRADSLATLRCDTRQSPKPCKHLLYCDSKYCDSYIATILMKWMYCDSKYYDSHIATILMKWMFQ